MANYKIVLNLKGNAVKQVAKLADELERAQKASAGLSRNLGGIGRRNLGGLSDSASGGVARARRGLTSWETTLSSSSGLGSALTLRGMLGAKLGASVMAAQAASVLLKGLAKYNFAAFTGGARLISAGANFLTSSQMSEGIRLLQRRQQARLGFGAQYAAAQERADLLAASYGLDPSNVIASMNVLTGMRVGNKKITMGQAERLTQVGGLIAQSSGLAFETVMVNIQQMMAQAVPSLRDIRQLLTHAPILGRYAIQEMESRGIKNMSAMDYLKADKGAVMRTFERFLAENPAVNAMMAQGIVRQSNVGFYSELAKNDSWLKIAEFYKALTEVVAPVANEMITKISNSDALRTSLNLFVVLFERLPKILDGLLAHFENSLPTWLKPILDLGGVKSEAIRRTEHQKKAALVLKSAGIDGFIGLSSYNEYVDSRPHVYRQAPTAYMGGFGAVTGLKNLVPASNELVTGFNKYHYTPSAKATGRYGFRFDANAFLRDWGVKTDSDESLLPLGGSPTGGGSDLSGYGRDRKALVINFQAPIVQWDSTINTDDPQDVVNEVADTLEQGVSKAIQIALLGATGRLSPNF